MNSQELIAYIVNDVDALVDDVRGSLDRNSPDDLRHYANRFNKLATVLEWAQDIADDDPNTEH